MTNIRIKLILVFCFSFSVVSIAQDPNFSDEEWKVFSDDLNKTLHNKEHQASYLSKAKKALAIAIGSKNNFAIAASYENMANYYNYYRLKPINIDSTIYYRNLANKYFLLTNKKQELADFYIKSGVSLKDFGLYSKGEAYVFNAISIFEELNNTEGLGLGYKVLCDICRHKKEYKEAINYGEQAIQKLSQSSLFKKLSPNLCLVSAYRKNNQFERAIEAANNYLDTFRVKKNNAFANEAYLLNERAEAYLELGKLDLALNDFQSAMMSSSNLLPNKLKAEANYYFFKKEYQEAISAFENFFNLHHKDNNAEFLPLIYSRLIECYIQEGNFKKASFYQKIEKSNLSGEYEENLLAVKNELRLKYEGEKKELTINSQELSIKKHQQFLFLAICLINLLVLLVCGLVWTYYNNKRKNKQLKDLTIELQEVNDAKSQFYTNLTHEFRTPITVISGVVNQINGYALEKEIILRNSSNLLNLVNQLLDFSKVVSNKIELNFVNGNIIFYIKYILESFFFLAEEKHLNLSFETFDQEIIMDFDEELIQRVVHNLLSNGIKFTQEGGNVKLMLQKIIVNDKPFLEMLVVDNGIGIDEEQIPKIFDRFYRVENSLTQANDGTGIGLSLTRELVQLINGEINVKSDQENGTEFTVLLPIENHVGNIKKLDLNQTPSVTSIHSNSAENLLTKLQTNANVDKDSPIVLVVEDNLDVTYYLQDLLSSTYKTISCKNGNEGINKAMEIIPDLIISDVMMPYKSGYELCQTLKEDERTSHIPIILLTAKATEENLITGLKLGADAYLVKPFKKEELITRIAQLIKLRNVLQKQFSANVKLKDGKTISIDEKFLLKARKIIESKIIESKFSPLDLGAELHLSRMQLYRKIKALTNKTPSSFIRLIRLENAKILLSEKEAKIADVAYKVGFSDPNYFSKTFKEEYGLTASKYKKQCLEVKVGSE